MDVRFYSTPAGNSPVEKYMESLPAKERAEVLDAFEEVRLRGLDAAQITTRQIDGKLWEIKVSRHRVFYVVIVGPTMVLLHAYKKQGQKAPRGEIAVASARMKEVLNG